MKKQIQLGLSLLLILVLFSLQAAFSQTQAPAPEAKQSAKEICPILNGAEVPDGTLQTADGKDFPFRESINKQPVVLIFYRGGWCPYCNKHLAAIQEAEAELIGLGYRIIAVSPDLPYELSLSMDKNKLNYTLLSDPKLEFTDQFGITFKLEESLVKKYKTWGLDVEKASGETHHRLPIPAVYIIDKKGFISFSYLNPDYKTRVDKDVLIAAAKAALK